MKYETKETFIVILAWIVPIFIFAMMLVQPYFEMKAFNKFSDSKATYTEAMFSNLRIVNQCQN